MRCATCGHPASLHVAVGPPGDEWTECYGTLDCECCEYVDPDEYCTCLGSQGGPDFCRVHAA